MLIYLYYGCSVKTLERLNNQKLTNTDIFNVLQTITQLYHKCWFKVIKHVNYK